MLISETPSDSIHKLVEVVDKECVRSTAAPSQEVVDRWMADHTSFLREGKSISPLEDCHAKLVSDASFEWSTKMGRFLRVFGYSETNFVCWFTAIRWRAKETGVILLRNTDETTYDILCRSSDLARQVVFNISWPTTFAAYLPKANLQSALESTAIGLQMSAVMWLENLARARDLSEIGQKSIAYDNSRFAKLDALVEICQERLCE